MKITCTQKELARGIAIANRAVSPRSTLPIMTYLRLVAADDAVHISGVSMSMRIDCAVGCEVNQAGALAIPAKLFGDIVSQLSGTVTLEVNDRTKTINILCGNYKAKLNGLDAEDFPSLPTDESLSSVEIKAATLRQVISQVAFAASTDLSRQTITGVEVVFGGELMTMAATDGYRMGIRRGRLNSPVDAASTVIVPATSLHEVAQALSTVEDEQPVTVQIFDNRIVFCTAGLEVSAQTIDGKFPDYRAIIPRDTATSAEVDRESLVRALRLARTLRNEASHVDLEITGDTLRVSITNAEVGESGDVLPATVTGKPIALTLNSGYMLDVLTRVDEPVIICTNGIGKPLLIRAAALELDKFCYVIMPIDRSR